MFTHELRLACEEKSTGCGALGWVANRGVETGRNRRCARTRLPSPRQATARRGGPVEELAEGGARRPRPQPAPPAIRGEEPPVEARIPERKGGRERPDLARAPGARGAPNATWEDLEGATQRDPRGGDFASFEPLVKA